MGRRTTTIFFTQAKRSTIIASPTGFSERFAKSKPTTANKRSRYGTNGAPLGARLLSLHGDKRIIRIHFGGLKEPATFLIDTGAPINIIKDTKLHGDTLCKHNSAIPIQGLFNEIQHSRFEALLQHEGKNHTFHVVRATTFPLKEDGIIGIDFLKATKGQVRLDTEELVLNGKSYRMKFPVLAKIPARTAMVIKVPVKQTQGTVFYSGGGLKQGLWIGPALLEANNGQAAALIQNLTSTEQIIPDVALETEPYSPQIPVKVNHIERKARGDAVDRLQLLQENTRLDHIPPDEAETIWDIISNYSDIFYLPGDELPATHLVKHRIITNDEGPVNIKQYRYPPAHKQEVERQVEDMLSKRIIRPSESPYNSPLWVVPKKADASGTKNGVS
jgi:Retroviral aspartyl protease.